ncbi:hypothetical protein [Nocardioides rubriscoriae]|uniref:hypothetical protein n=1 Tax=Nocardioides rubriscoriae TaxID=642762 RepID=UPI0011E022E2|nr:hypothetical protein [Nocardioides rubriscoriae]
MTPRPELSAARAADFEESPQLKIKRLERTLADERKFAVKSTRQLHRVLTRELREAEKSAVAAERRAVAAEKRAAAARGRAERAEAELERIRQSATWKAGRAVVAVPARIRRRVGRS